VRINGNYSKSFCQYFNFYSEVRPAEITKQAYPRGIQLKRKTRKEEERSP
jgi:hypothetical protein